MRGDDAYAVLGLRPGAGRAEIDQAYRRLIKRYHPDYAEGDSRLAAEINRAYSELRARGREMPRDPPPARVAPAQHYAPRPARRGAMFFGASALTAAAALALTASMPETRRQWPRFSSNGGALAVGGSLAVRPPQEAVRLDEPLATELIGASVADAMRLHAGKDLAAAAEFSRECLIRLGANPSVQLFDSCAAYDEAIAILAAGNSTFESGPFNPSAVTARQVGAARLLSADYFEAESRLQRIRSRVQMVLLPRISDAGLVRERELPSPVPELETAEVPDVAQAVPPRSAVSRTKINQATQRVRPAAQRRPAPSPRPAVVRPVQRAAAPAPTQAAAQRQVPAWQNPIKPAWQRPLPSPGD